jgi:hypothetical protein
VVDESRPTSRVVRFGSFQLDLRSGELVGNGRTQSLPEQPLTILALLLQHPGELVLRDELRQQLWSSDTFVDFEHGLNAAVKRLRAALSDSADTSRPSLGGDIGSSHPWSAPSLRTRTPSAPPTWSRRLHLLRPHGPRPTSLTSERIREHEGHGAGVPWRWSQA